MSSLLDTVAGLLNLPSLDPFSRTLLLVMLRALPVCLSGTVLWHLCIKPTIPALLMDARSGFATGWSRSVTNGLGSTTDSTDSSGAVRMGAATSRLESRLDSILDGWRLHVLLIQLVRFGTLAIGTLVALEWAAVATGLASRGAVSPLSGSGEGAGAGAGKQRACGPCGYGAE